MSSTGTPRRVVAFWKLRSGMLRPLGVRPGMGILFTPQSRRKLGLSAVASVITALLEMAAITTVLPVMLLLTGSTQRDGVLGDVARFLGNPSDSQLAAILALLMFATFLVKAVVSITVRWWTLGLLQHEEVRTSTVLMAYYLRAPYALHLRRSAPEFLVRVNDFVTSAYFNVVGGAMSFFTESCTLLAIVVLLLVASPVVALVALAYLGLAAVVFLRWTRPRVVRANERRNESTQEIFHSAFESMALIKDIQIRGTGGYFLRRFRRARATNARTLRESAFYGDLPKYVLELLFISGIAGITALVFATHPSGSALGLIALFAAAGFRALPSVTRLMSALTSVSAGADAVDRILPDVRAAMDRAERERDALDGTDLEASGPLIRSARMPLHRELRLSGVTFGYGDAAVNVVDDVSFTVPVGTSLALVGASGAGKSTLVDLILGLHEPRAGTITADGVDVRGDLRAWRANLGVVPQDVVVTDASVRRNIALGIDDADVDESRLAEVLADAQLTDTVAAMPAGLDTNCGSRGVRLSGGQRQRVGIARALYPRPAVLVLDEATSSLDGITEQQITDTIARLAGQVTVIVVAHRLSTVRDCDTVVFLDEGRVRAIGSFEQVRDANAHFARLVELGRLD